jgi:UPF0755 protein
MWRSIASNAISILAIVLFLLAGLIMWGQGQYREAGPLASAICLKVDRGSNMIEVSRNLEESQAISSGSLFRIGVKYAEKDQDLKAGSFLVPAQSSMTQIVSIITDGGPSTCGTEIVYRIGVSRQSVQVRELDPDTGRFVEKMSFDPAGETPDGYQAYHDTAGTRYRIAFAEGVSSWQVVEGLTSIDVLRGEVDGLPAEGSLAPDSYEIRSDDTRESVLERMTSAQTDILNRAWESRADGLPLETPQEALILASIIEKETGVAEERGLVASVFVNRLNKSIRLQTDPSVIYGLIKGQGTLGRGLRQSELKRKTDWNTYVIDGLPKTPIANPGRAAIEAALNPDISDFIFFVADGTGGHAFASTLREHNVNVRKWREIEASKSN